MEETKNIQAGTRKARAGKGEQAQKMMSFRVDLDNWQWLTRYPNKGRYINDLIKNDREKN